MTDITNTVKTSLFVEALTEGIEDLKKENEDFIERLRADPAYVMGSSYANDTFERAAKIYVRTALLYHFSDERAPERISREDVNKVVWGHACHCDPVARSTSPASNMMEQCRLKVAMGIMNEDWSFREWRNAQRKDPELQAIWDAQRAIERAEMEQYAEAIEENKKFDRRARRLLRK